MSVESSKSDVERSAPKGAVFLSYASQDAEAAKRIADALRAAGVEVWFDQNELVGGDQWDTKIRGQISSCALFVPIISANTQARLEGYFRLEWKLAAQRTHTMADEVTFLLPVLVDGTRDAEAKVPAEFRAVQWTKLPGGETTPAFCARVKKLLSGEPAASGPGTQTPDPRPQPQKTSTRNRPLSRWWWAAPVFGMTMAFALLLREPSKPTSPPPVAAPAAAVQTEAQKLVQQAQAIYAKCDELDRETLGLADDLVKRALVLDPAEPSAWILAARLSYLMVWQGFDDTEARNADLLRQSTRARALAPDSVAAQLAVINAQLAVGFANFQSATNRQDLAALEGDLLALAARAPQDPQVQQALGQTCRFLNRPDEALQYLRRAHELSGGQSSIAADVINVLLRRKRYAEAEAMVAPAFARQPVGRILVLDVLFKTVWRGDLPAAQAAVAAWPGWLLREDRGAFVAWQTWMFSRRPDLALEVAARLPRDYLRDVWFTGPRAVLTARAHELAGHAEAAQADWRTVLRLAERELAGSPDDVAGLYWKAWAQSRLGDAAGAQATSNLLHQRNLTNTVFFRSTSLALLWTTMGRTDLAVDVLRTSFVALDDAYAVTRKMLELDPVYATLRADPRYPELRDAALAPKPETLDPKPTRPPEADDKSVAVLAFANLSEDKANEYFSDGISEELLNVLAKVPGLKVSARTSAFYFKGKEVPVPEIARQLGVAYVVEGSVRKAGDKVRITAQLIKAADGFHVWSDTFTRDLKDIFAVQDEIAGLIAQNLQLKLVSASPGSIDPALYERLLEARAAAGRENNQDWRRAITLYQDIVTRNPRAAAAWGEMARVYVQLARFGGMPLGEGMREARRAAQQALEIDPNLAIGHVALGWVQRTADWDWRGALRSFNRARELAPDDCAIMGDAAVLLLNIGQIDEAVRLARAGAARDPLNARAQASLGYVLALAGRSEEALPPIRRAIELAPAIDEAHSHLARALLRLGRIDEAEQAANLEPHDAYRWNVQSLIMAKRGRTAESERVFNQFQAKYRDEMPGYIAVSLAMRGQTDQAFEWIERAIALRDSSIPWFKTNAYLESLRSDPRWDKFLHRLGLADEQLR